jgi:Fe-S-cluster containining protein
MTRVADPPDEDTRASRELSESENADLCAGCTQCCRYVTIEVDPPRQAWEYDQWIWMLHHENLEMYVERPEAWFVYIATLCTQLNDEGRCAIHGRHPVLCRDYDPRSCERRYPYEDVRAWFKTGFDLEQWVRTERPAHWKRLVKYRGDMPQAPPKARGRGSRQSGRNGGAQALVQISLAAPRGNPRIRT